MSDNFDAVLSDLAERAVRTIFVPGAVKPENEHTMKLRAIGICVSAWAGWDPDEIMEVFIAALEDANCHEAVAIIRDTWDELARRYNEPIEFTYLGDTDDLTMAPGDLLKSSKTRNDSNDFCSF